MAAQSRASQKWRSARTFGTVEYLASLLLFNFFIQLLEYIQYKRVSFPYVFWTKVTVLCLELLHRLWSFGNINASFAIGYKLSPKLQQQQLSFFQRNECVCVCMCSEVEEGKEKELRVGLGGCKYNQRRWADCDSSQHPKREQLTSTMCWTW